MAALVEGYEAALPEGGWPTGVLGNHDQPRIAGRLGQNQAQLAAILLLTLRGTPTLYHGDEIGLGRVTIPPERVQDPWERNEPGHGRDPHRTPMQWEAAPHAGFSTVEPWLPLSHDCLRRNVDEMRDDPNSLLTFYPRLLRLRRDFSALSVGRYCAVPLSPEFVTEVFTYDRFDGTVQLRIVLNFGMREHRLALPDGSWTVMLSSQSGRAGDRLSGELMLDPEEGLVLMAG